MRVSHVALDDYRSYRHAVVELEPGTTVLVGRNGQGKTNLVEAIAYLSTFSSHRVAAEGALVRVPPEGSVEEPPGGALIRVKLVTGEHTALDDGTAGGPPVGTGGGEGRRDRVIELEIVRGRANRARLNRTQVRPRDILGLVHTVVFAPEDLQLVRGDPSSRRIFLDDLATQLRPTLVAVRSDFDRVARQRAALMKQAQARQRRGMAPDLSTLDVWDHQFCALSAELTAARSSLVDRLRDPVARAYDEVADSPRHLEIAMACSVDRVLGAESGDSDAGSPDPGDVPAQAERLHRALESVRPREIERGVNLVGAHRDDLDLTLGGLPVKGYASHGESWSSALALRMAAFSVLEEGGEEPILILDDVFSELDASRREGLARMVRDADQVIVTAAVEEDVPPQLQGHRLRVHSDPVTGTVVEESRDGRR